CSLFYNVAWVF
nr:immunoglobulin light chain junction region [Macaca mulatta]MPN65213.1 immunoglobulin light chain junction region [Macaca mulatta]MPN65225.1 immunoglobulin light chain junction region [Macaca mulatta]MPN65243.1 immunoglobulin light chain junction region [Macaca mulatta]MPN65251.1 immunoglobulin light chain junction region [Macaca mulatta]